MLSDVLLEHKAYLEKGHILEATSYLNKSLPEAKTYDERRPTWNHFINDIPGAKSHTLDNVLRELEPHLEAVKNARHTWSKDHRYMLLTRSTRRSAGCTCTPTSGRRSR